MGLIAVNQQEKRIEEREAPQTEVDRRFKRYTAQARQVLALARAEAQQRHHDYLGGEHLLLAIARDGRSNAAQMLTNLGIDLEEVTATVEFLVHPGTELATSNTPYTPRILGALDLAEDEARRNNHAAAGTDDLLLGLVREGTNVAAKVLSKFDVSLPRVRAQVERLASSDREREADAGRTKGNVLTCRIDDRDLAVLDALVEAGIRPTRSAAAAWLIHAGIEANRSLVDKVYAALTEIRRLRDEVQGVDPAE